MTAPTASAQSPNANNTFPEIANEVGVVFAHEFYTFLNKEPSRLHCFYNKNSTMSHGYQGEQIQVFSGQQVYFLLFPYQVLTYLKERGAK